MASAGQKNPSDVRPVIAVSGPDRGGTAAWWFTRFAVYRSGGRTRRVTPERPGDWSGVDALILGGGADVHPKHYGEVSESRRPQLEQEADISLLRRLAGWALFPVVLVMRLLFSRASTVAEDADRDALELELLERAVAQRLPVLGICRGAQLINVYFGGTLHRDLSEFYQETPAEWTILPRKRIRIEPESRLAGLLGSQACFVNALHRQAVDRLGAGLRVAARESTDVVQAIEHTEQAFLIGVQWHPEYLLHLPEQQRLFAALIAAARPG